MSDNSIAKRSVNLSIGDLLRIYEPNKGMSLMQDETLIMQDKTMWLPFWCKVAVYRYYAK